jgi:hypothetical protein
MSSMLIPPRCAIMQHGDQLMTRTNQAERVPGSQMGVFTKRQKVPMSF